MVGNLPEDVDRLTSVGLDAVGSFDEADLDTSYEQEDAGAERYSAAEAVAAPVTNEHYIG